MKKATLAEQWNTWLAVVAGSGGAVALVLGWKGLVGEPIAALQGPYLFSGGFVGVVLVVVAAVALIGGELARMRRRMAELQRQILEEFDDLRDDLVHSCSAGYGDDAPGTLDDTVSARVASVANGS